MCSGFLKVFQAQILRKYPRRPSASFWYHLQLRTPTFDRFRHLFQFVFISLTPKIWKSNFFPLFLKEQALKPCSGPRSRDLLHRKKNNSSVRPNLTDLVTKQGRARFCNLIGHVFDPDCLILGVSADFPYFQRCVHAGPKREPSKHSLWEKLAPETKMKSR